MVIDLGATLDIFLDVSTTLNCTLWLLLLRVSLLLSTALPSRAYLDGVYLTPPNAEG